MKSLFTKTWNRSVQARKQRKFRANAPLHARTKLLHAPLTKDLRTKHKKRSVRVRTGDEVEVMRGSHAGKKGVVERVDTKAYRVYVRGVDTIKREGTKVAQALAVSNVRITKLVEDKRRFA